MPDDPNQSFRGNFMMLVDAEGDLIGDANPLPVEVTGEGDPFTGLTDDELRATPVPVSGPLTDAELRATDLDVVVVKPNQIVDGTLVIANGQSLSSTGGDANDGIIDLRKKSLVGIQMPAAWTAAALTFSVSMDEGTTFNNLYDDAGTERSVTTAESRAITLDPTKFMGCTHLKIRSGTSAAAVNQAAQRTLIYTTIAL